MRRADRLIKIVHFLRSRRRAVTAKTIAQEFEICTRTVYRDIRDLMNSDVPISGEAGVGYIIDKQYYLPPVTFDTHELEAIGLGISMVRQWTDEHFAKKADSAFAKIQAVLPASLQGELEQITTYSMTNQSYPNQPALDQSALNQTTLPWTVSFSQLRACIRDHKKIMIVYTDESTQITSRILRPLALIFCGPIWLLAAWCETRDDFRNFRLDRIMTLELCGNNFEDDADKNLSAYKVQDAMC